jgi:hypothetical protein
VQAGLHLARPVGLADGGRIVDLTHLGADQMRRDEDPASAAELQAAQEDLVVARQDVEPVDRSEVVVVGLFDRDDVVDRRQLGEEVRRQVDHAAGGDVVEDDRRVVCRARHRLEVGAKPGPVGLVVVRRHDENGVRPGVDGAPGQLDRVVGVVGTRAADQRQLVPELAPDRLEQLQLLVVGEGRRLARGPREHEPVRAVLGEVAGEAARRVGVEPPVVVERGDHRGDYPRDRRHGG